jgi:acyl-CoA thioester hydrolase
MHQLPEELKMHNAKHSAQIEVRVRYVDTDRMGIAHHTHHFSWMEAARTELMRQGGLSYRELEERGYTLPVREAYCRYRKGLEYDEIVTVCAELLVVGEARLKIGYKIYREKDRVLAAEGYTVHPFIDRSGKIVKTPDLFKKLFSPSTS